MEPLYCRILAFLLPPSPTNTHTDKIGRVHSIYTLSETTQLIYTLRQQRLNKAYDACRMVMAWERSPLISSVCTFPQS